MYMICIIFFAKYKKCYDLVLSVNVFNNFVSFKLCIKIPIVITIVYDTPEV